MKMTIVLFAVIVSFIGLSASIPAQADQKRGFENYQAIMAGKKQFGELSVEEQQEVMMIYRVLKRSDAPSDASDDCKDAWRDAESAASELSSYAKDL